MKLCIIKTSSLGDIVQSFPVVQYLKDRLPNAEIDWVVERAHQELVQSHPEIAQVISVDTRSWRKAPFSKTTWEEITAFRNQMQQTPYDAVFDLQGNLKSGLLLSLTKSSCKVGFGWSSAPECLNGLFTQQKFTPPPGQNIREDYLSLAKGWMKDVAPYTDPGIRLQISAEQKKQIQTILAHRGPGKKVLVSAGSAWRNKQVPKEALIPFLQYLQRKTACHFLFIWGSQEERAEAEILQKSTEQSQVLERLPLPVLQNLMGEIDLVIAMDSLPLHLAGSIGTPTFSLFGPSSAKKYQPVGKNNGSFQGSCPYGRRFEKRCPILRKCTTGACLREQPADALFLALCSSDAWSIFL